MSSDTTAMHCSTRQSKLDSPLFGAALHNRLTAGLYYRNYIYTDLLFIQVCTAALVWANCIANCSVVLSKPGSQQACVNAVTPMEICSHTGVQRANRNARQHCSGQIAFPTVWLCFAKQAYTRLMSMQSHLWRFALHTGVQWHNSNALQHWAGQTGFPTVQCCSAKQPQSWLVSLQLHLPRFAVHTDVL